MSSTASRPSAIVVGTGAGGGMIARELQGQYQVTILEQGKAFKPLCPICQYPFVPARHRHLF